MTIRSRTYPALWRGGVFAGPSVAELLPALYRLNLDIDLDAGMEQNWEDVEDVRETLSGDEDAYRRLIERHQDWIGARMWKFSRDETVHQELVQDVFVEAWKSLRGYASKAPFRHWLARIATRVGYRYWKKRDTERKTGRAQSGLVPPSAPAEFDAGDSGAREAAELLYSLLDRLPPRDRLVLMLRYVEDLDVEETARRCGWSKAMVKVQSHRARQKLKRLFESKREAQAR